VDDARGMQALQPIQDLACVVDDFFDPQDAGAGIGDIGFTDHGPQRIAVIVHDIIGAPLVHTEIEHVDDVDMPDAGHGNGFLDKETVQLLPSDQPEQKVAGCQDLEGQKPPDDGDFDLQHFSHTAATEQPADAVFIDAFHGWQPKRVDQRRRVAWDSGNPAARIFFTTVSTS
jgi:hypothetical protein